MIMHGPDGHEYDNRVVFDVVEPPERLVLRYVDEAGKDVLHVNTITLDELGPKRTRIHLSLRFPSAQLKRQVLEAVGALEGGKQTLQRLVDLLDELQAGRATSDDGVVVRRVLAAPPEQVWAAWTDARHLQRWFHPRSWTIFQATLDLRVGGAFHYGFRGPDLADTWALWRFTQVDPPRRLAFVQSFADEQGGPAATPFGGPWPERIATTVTLDPHAGIGRGTVLTVRATPLDATDAQQAAFRQLGPSMHTGWGETLDSLVEFLSHTER